MIVTEGRVCSPLLCRTSNFVVPSGEHSRGSDAYAGVNQKGLLREASSLREDHHPDLITNDEPPLSLCQ